MNLDERALAPIIQLTEEEESGIKESQMEPQPKALAIISPDNSLDKGKRKGRIEKDQEEFVLSKEIILTLKKNNLCIRPISGNSKKKGSTAQRKRLEVEGSDQREVDLSL